ncbi:U-box domain-containing protein 4 [Apostasia shenzhenica]|uniref:U-box domain-containing protein 4 n=1 Tax=Apostasia shenzhenica TaxID=1088818 RepID=A0A2I0AYW4_9ASPA|nr:U-box domain-containing protein 4 [Apostasia shenzhenica]
MVEAPDEGSTEHWLSRAHLILPVAREKVQFSASGGGGAARGFAGRWKSVSSKLERMPQCLSDLSCHPFFSKNALCREQLQSMAATLSEVIELADRAAAGDHSIGKLQMQSDLDALAGKLDLNLRDCGLLIKTGVLGEVSMQSLPSEGGDSAFGEPKIRELLARLQIGHAEAKHRAIDGLLEAMREDEKAVVAALGRSSISAIVQLLTSTAPKIREKAAMAVCLLAESGNCEAFLVSEGALPPLIKLVESGTLVGREKALISLQRLSMSADTARTIAAHGGIHPLIEACWTGDSIAQLAAAGSLKNLSAAAELTQSLADEGAIRIMIHLLDCGSVLGAKEYAAECLQNLSSFSESARKAIVSEGGIRSLLAYIDGPLPQESAVAALRNLVASISIDSLISLGVLHTLFHVLKEGSLGAKHAAASAICRISSSPEVKRLIEEIGCVGLLIKMLDSKSNMAREVAAQAIAGLMSYRPVSRHVKKDEMSVPSLVQLLDPNPVNTAKKYAVSCLLSLSSSKKCRRMMISHGAIGYLKKLSEMEVPDGKKLLYRLDRGTLKKLFSNK